MANKISKADFTFRPSGRGRYSVTYTSPVTGKAWSANISDMSIIDMVKSTPTPLVKYMEALKRMCKRGYHIEC